MNKQRQHRRVWTQQVPIALSQQDDTLKMYVNQSTDLAKPKWKQISQLLNTELNLQFKRNPKQCRQRWYNSLAPASQQTRVWGVEDDVTLIQACKKYGHRWSRLTKEFDQSVNDNRLKNHFYSTVRKIVRVINTIVKQAKKQYQSHIKQGSLHTYSEQQQQKLKQISKLRTFQPKLLSKVFSLIDEKQQYRYEAKQSLEVEQLRAINDQILDFMEDYVAGRNQFSNTRVLSMVIKVMHINRTIKTKYVRQVKLSIQDEDEVQRQQQNRKKRQKKINTIVKQELENKIIPDRKTKIQIINKIRDQNKKLNKLIKPDKRRIKRKALHGGEGRLAKGEIGDGGDGGVEGDGVGRDERMDMVDEREFNQSFQYPNQSVMSKEKNPKSSKYSHQKSKPPIQLSSQSNLNPSPTPIPQKTTPTYNAPNDFDQNYLKNSNSFNYTLGLGLDRDRSRDRSNLPPSLFSYNSNIPSYNNILSFSVDDLVKKGNNLQLNKSKSKSISKSSIQEEERYGYGSSNNRNNMMEGEEAEGEEDRRREEKSGVKDHPFVSNFLNDIPHLTSNDNGKKQKVEIMEAMNPFFPEHKLSHSQGYFTFDKPVFENVERQDNDLFRSNPNIGSINFVQIQNQKGQQQQKKSLKNSKNFQGLFASYNDYSNNDLISEQSQRMKSSLFDLIPNFHPMHTSAFCPILFGISKQNQNEIRQNRPLEVSKPLSAHFHQNIGLKFNMDQSQRIGLYRSSDLQGDSNPSGVGLYHSYSFGQLSQENKSNRSKVKK